MTIDISLELIQETLIALRNRENELRKDLYDPIEVIREVSQRQLGRVQAAINVLLEAEREATRKGKS